MAFGTDNDCLNCGIDIGPLEYKMVGGEEARLTNYCSGCGEPVEDVHPDLVEDDGPNVIGDVPDVLVEAVQEAAATYGRHEAVVIGPTGGNTRWGMEDRFYIDFEEPGKSDLYLHPISKAGFDIISTRDNLSSKSGIIRVFVKDVREDEPDEDDEPQTIEYEYSSTGDVFRLEAGSGGHIIKAYKNGRSVGEEFINALVRKL